MVGDFAKRGFWELIGEIVVDKRVGGKWGRKDWISSNSSRTFAAKGKGYTVDAEGQCENEGMCVCVCVSGCFPLERRERDF